MIDRNNLEKTLEKWEIAFAERQQRHEEIVEDGAEPSALISSNDYLADRASSLVQGYAILGNQNEVRKWAETCAHCFLRMVAATRENWDEMERTDKRNVSHKCAGAVIWAILADDRNLQSEAIEWTRGLEEELVERFPPAELYYMKAHLLVALLTDEMDPEPYLASLKNTPRELPGELLARVATEVLAGDGQAMADHFEWFSDYYASEYIEDEDEATKQVPLEPNAIWKLVHDLGFEPAVDSPSLHDVFL